METFQANFKNRRYFNANFKNRKYFNTRAFQKNPFRPKKVFKISFEIVRTLKSV